jgi:hypothetical protein
MSTVSFPVVIFEKKEDSITNASQVHMIPKPNKEEGLGIEWPMQSANKDKLQQLLEEIKAKM